jgi:PAS domain-containing protein
MIGIYLNLILIALAVSALICSVSFFASGSGIQQTRNYTLAIGISTFLINIGYSLMAFSADVTKAWIPRFIGLYGIDVFLLIELSFLLYDMKTKIGTHAIILGIFTVYALFDLIIHGSPNTFLYVRYDNLFTSYELQNRAHHYFHYSYITIIALTMFVIGVTWYRMQKTRHDKDFALRLILSNLIIILEALPDIVAKAFVTRHPSFFYCVGFSTVFFMWYISIIKQSYFVPTIKNTAAEVFGVVDVPILILDFDGKIRLFNPAAKRFLGINENTQCLRDILNISDVEMLRISAKARRGEKSERTTTTKDEKVCVLKNYIKFDSALDPFCIIATVLFKE